MISDSRPRHTASGNILLFRGTAHHSSQSTSFHNKIDFFWHSSWIQKIPGTVCCGCALCHYAFSTQHNCRFPPAWQTLCFCQIHNQNRIWLWKKGVICSYKHKLVKESMDLFTRPKLLKQYCHILLTNITNIKRKKYLSVCENKKRRKHVY